MEQGYIYIRRNNWYDMYNACKLGKTSNLPDRNSQYITGEIERGYFYSIFRVDIIFLNQIENELQNEFIDYNIYKKGGIEFYSIKIINLIEPFLKNKNYKYYTLTQIEINNLIHCTYDKNYKKLNMQLENIIKPNLV